MWNIWAKSDGTARYKPSDLNHEMQIWMHGTLQHVSFQHVTKRSRFEILFLELTNKSFHARTDEQSEDLFRHKKWGVFFYMKYFKALQNCCLSCSKNLLILQRSSSLNKLWKSFSALNNPFSTLIYSFIFTSRLFQIGKSFVLKRAKIQKRMNTFWISCRQICNEWFEMSR